MTQCRKSFALVAGVLLAAAGIWAQQISNVTEFRKPGNTIEFLVTLDGSDLTEITAVGVRLDLDGSPRLEQKGFSTVIQGNETKPIGPNKFAVSVPVPDAAATGDYRMTAIYISFKTPNRPQAYYNAGSDFQAPKVIRVENPKHFENPKIKEVTEAP
jgi:hypothetical protein